MATGLGMSRKKPQKQAPPKPRFKPPMPRPQPPSDEPIRERKRHLHTENNMLGDQMRKRGLGFAKTMKQSLPEEVGPRPVPLPPHKPKGPHPIEGWSPGAGGKSGGTADGRKRKARMQPYEGPSMDGIDSRNNPPKTMEYDPERDGRADAPIDNWDGEDPGFENMGKQENNEKWKYDNWRSEEGRPVPEDKDSVYNDLFDEGARRRPNLVDGNPTEIAQWEREVRRKAAEAGLSKEEIDDLINDLVDLD